MRPATSAAAFSTRVYCAFRVHAALISVRAPQTRGPRAIPAFPPIRPPEHIVPCCYYYYYYCYIIVDVSTPFGFRAKRRMVSVLQRRLFIHDFFFPWTLFRTGKIIRFLNVNLFVEFWTQMGHTLSEAFFDRIKTKKNFQLKNPGKKKRWIFDFWCTGNFDWLRKNYASEIKSKKISPIVESSDVYLRQFFRDIPKNVGLCPWMFEFSKNGVFES